MAVGLRPVWWLIALTLVGPSTAGALLGDEADSQNKAWITTFSADVSPPLGRRVCVGFVPAFKEIEHPLLAKGILLKDEGGVYVLCALDYQGLCNDSYKLFRAELAQAAGTTPERVAVQSLHQHTAPVLDANADRLLYAADPEALSSGEDAAGQAAEEVAQAVREATTHWRRLTHIGTSLARVDRVASNRRVPQPDGSFLTRYSGAGGDPVLRDAPEGTIDPYVRTISFYDGDRAVVRLHYYATHPQTRSGDRVTYDVPGIARERLESESGTFQVYFTGCGGNVAMGKYNDGSEAAREALAQRLYEGMAAAVAAEEPQRRQPVRALHWSTQSIEFPLRTDADFTAAACRKRVDDAATPFAERLKAAMLLAWIERVRSGQSVEASCLAIGSVRIVHLPGEPFVEFQLAAQQARPDLFVAVAGYGECAMWYLGEDRIYTDRGGYEQTWSFVGPCEQRMHHAIADLLNTPE